jgi:hypothetical protein
MSNLAVTRAHQPAALSVALTPLLVSIVTMPTALFYIGLASSMALGSMVVSCSALIIAFMVLKISGRQLSHLILFLPFLCGAIVLHLFIMAVLGMVDLQRGLASLFPLCVCISGGWAAAALFSQARNDELSRALKRCFLFLVVIAICGLADFMQPPAAVSYPKPMFPFTEPSHFVLVLTPFLIYFCVSAEPWKRLFYIAAALLGTALLENLTMAAATVAAAALCLRVRYILIITGLLVPVLASLDLTYFTQRLVFGVESTNLSSLVYLQGWQMLIESVVSTHGLGLGFQQLGVFGTNVPASAQLHILLGDSLNLLDGGFNMAKLLSEFGVFGGFLLVVFFYYALQAILLLRRTALYRERHPTALLFAAACIVGYSIELLLRGTGYFTPTGILLVYGLLTWRNYKASFWLTKRLWRIPTEIRHS